MDIRGIPVGFGFALAMDPDALRNFAILPAEQRSHVIDRARAISDRTAMQNLIGELSEGKLTD